jgi:hypothetical protein
LEARLHPWFEDARWRTFVNKLQAINVAFIEFPLDQPEELAILRVEIRADCSPKEKSMISSHPQTRAHNQMGRKKKNFDATKDGHHKSA